MDSVKFIISFQTKPAATADFRTMLAGVARDLPRVAGCRGVDVLCADDDACVFTLVEEWESKAAHKAHVDGLVSSGAWETIASHLDQPPTSHYFNQLK